MIVLDAAHHNIGGKKKILPEASEQTFLAILPTEAVLQREECHSSDLIIVPLLITYVA